MNYRYFISLINNIAKQITHLFFFLSLYIIRKNIFFQSTSFPFHLLIVTVILNYFAISELNLSRKIVSSFIYLQTNYNFEFLEFRTLFMEVNFGCNIHDIYRSTVRIIRHITI